MFFNSLAYAQEAPTGVQGFMAGGNGFFVMILLFFAIMYFLIIRPQQKRQKEHLAKLDSIKSGDTILTNGGIYGVVISVIDTQTFLVEVANGVKVKVAKGGIATKIEPSSPIEKIEEKK